MAMMKRLSEFPFGGKVAAEAPGNSIQQNKSAAIEWAGRISLKETLRLLGFLAVDSTEDQRCPIRQCVSPLEVDHLFQSKPEELPGHLHEFVD
jgi:hypothetical protein